jgi:hypothetical protein
MGRGRKALDDVPSEIAPSFFRSFSSKGQPVMSEVPKRDKDWSRVYLIDSTFFADFLDLRC